MSAIKFSNNASSLLAASVVAGDLTLQVGAGEGALFPSPGANEYFLVALTNAAGDLEICKCTSRSTDLLTVVRGQEGTSAQSWTNGATRVELRVTKGTMEAMLQKTGDAMSGDLDMDGNDIVDARLTGDTVMVAGQLVGTAIRGTEDDASNEIVVPSDGSRATAGGSPILTEDDGVMESMPIGAIILWYGSLGSLPTGWALCNGSNGTPDLRGAFVRGAGTLALGASGGAATATGNTDSGGSHSHTITVDNHTLTESEMPAHNHGIRGSTSTSGSVDENFQGGGMAGPAAAYNSGPTSVRDTNSLGEDLTETVGGGAAHGHTASSAADGSHTHGLSSVSTIPPYVAIYYIMKVS